MFPSSNPTTAAAAALGASFSPFLLGGAPLTNGGQPLVVASLSPDTGVGLRWGKSRGYLLQSSRPPPTPTAFFDTLVPGDLNLPPWAQTQLATTNGGVPTVSVSGAVYRLNAAENSVANGALAQRFATPPGLTGVDLTFKYTLGPAGTPGRQCRVSLFSADYSTEIGFALVTPTTTEQTSTTAIVLVADTGYVLVVSPETTGAPGGVDVLLRDLKVTPTTGASGTFVPPFRVTRWIAPDASSQGFRTLYDLNPAHGQDTVALAATSAVMLLSSDATRLACTYQAQSENGAIGGNSGPFVEVNGRWIYAFENATGNNQTVCIDAGALLPAGVKTSGVGVGISAVDFASQENLGDWPIFVYSDVPTVQTVVRESGLVVGVFGDSLQEGGAVGPPYGDVIPEGQSQWDATRRLAPIELWMWARGSTTLLDYFIQSGPNNPTLATLAAAYPEFVPDVLWMAHGFNDYHHSAVTDGESAINFGINLGQWIDEAHAAWPAAQIVVATVMLHPFFEATANSFGDLPQDYRNSAAAAVAASGRSAYTTITDGAVYGQGVAFAPSDHVHQLANDLLTVRHAAVLGLTIAPKTPVELYGSSLVQWLDAQDAATLTTDGTTPAGNGVGIGSWLDKSGNALHEVQVIAGSQPLRADGSINGQRGVSFDGVDDFLQSASVDLSAFGRAEVWFVLICDDLTTAGGVVQLGTDYLADNGFFVNVNYTANDEVSGWLAPSLQRLVQTGLTTTTAHIYRVAFQRVGSTSISVRMWIDGHQVSTAPVVHVTAGTFGNLPLSTGKNRSGGIDDAFLKAKLGERIVVIRWSTTEEAAAMDVTLQSRWATPALTP